MLIFKKNGEHTTTERNVAVLKTAKCFVGIIFPENKNVFCSAEIAFYE